jgi:hypothetical protein
MMWTEEGWDPRRGGLEDGVKAIGPETSADKGDRSYPVQLCENSNPIHDNGVCITDRSPFLDLVEPYSSESRGQEILFKKLEVGLFGFVGSDHNPEFAQALAHLAQNGQEHLLVLGPG